MKKIYLDTNILVSSFSSAASDQQQQKAVVEIFKIFSELKDVEIWTSMWAVTEMVKALTINVKMEPQKVSEIETNLLNESRLHGVKIFFADVSQARGYDFREFFYHIRRGILEYNTGLGDVMHATIMKNNDIEHILTFDAKDFEKIPGLIVINPSDSIRVS